MQQLHERLEFINMEGGGRNALDFQIAYHLGGLTKEDPAGFFHVISRDKGFDPLIQHLKSKHISAVRSASIEEMLCLQPTKKVNASQSSPNDKELLDLVIADLRNRKASKPGRLKTMLGTIRAVCGKELPESKLDSVFKSLVRLSYVKVEGTKVQFNGL
jgi:hypothetical protein